MTESSEVNTQNDSIIQTDLSDVDLSALDLQTPPMPVRTVNDVIMQSNFNETDIPKPVGWRILVEPIKIEEMTAGGLALPKAALEAKEHLRFICRVMAMGDLCYKHEKFEGSEPWCKVGDWIAINQYTGQEIMIRTNDSKELVTLKLINDDEVMSIVPNPKAVLIYCD